ncbi:hypothetical protein Acsp01_64660 [Actinoplanes sp. NBRC 101535]|nr:hypothetical protein Acsp01_64660 [Actinoplanes sp. NBRC 101535]
MTTLTVGDAGRCPGRLGGTGMCGGSPASVAVLTTTLLRLRYSHDATGLQPDRTPT